MDGLKENIVDRECPHDYFKGMYCHICFPNTCKTCQYWNEKLVDVPARGQCMKPKGRGEITKLIEWCEDHKKEGDN